MMSQVKMLQARIGAPWATEARALLKLGLPLAATQLAQMAVMTTDTLMIGHLGAVPLAAAALGFNLYLFGWLIAAGPSMAISPIVAQAQGRDPNDVRSVRHAIRMGLWAVVIASVPIFVLYASAPSVLALLGQKPEVIALAGPYVFSLAPGIPFALGYAALRNLLSALGHTRMPLIIGAAMIALNALLDYAFIFGHFGAPRLGIVGAGVATSLANALSFVALLTFAVFAPRFRRFEILSLVWQPDWTMLKEVFRIGVPIAITMAFEITLFQVGMFLMGIIGTAELAANQIAMNVASVTFMVPLGLAMGGTVRVGLAAGAGDRIGARRAAAVTISLGAGFMALAGLAIVLFREGIASLYLGGQDAANAHVIALASGFLVYAALFQVFDAMQVTGAHALRGLKDTKVPAILAGLSYWGTGIPAAALLAFAADMRGTGIWLGYLAGLIVAAALLLARLHLITREQSWVSKPVPQTA